MTDKTPTTMRIVHKTIPLTRRNFMRGGGLAAIGVMVAPAALAKPVQAALIESFHTIGQGSAKTLLVMARDIFPHERLADSYYVQALDPYEKAAGKDAALKALIQNGTRDLDKAAQKRFGKPYAQVAAESDRVLLLKAIETTPFFQKVRGDMVTSLYDNKAIWPLFGYEGSSWEKGGYIKRGFDDLDWL